MTPFGPRAAAISILGLALVAALVSPPASADWLVMQDGSRLEIEGAWRVDGRRVLFTLPNGTLSALRSNEVDLPSSEALTAAKKREMTEQDAAAEPMPEPPRWTFTNADIPRAPQIQEALEIEPLVGAEGFEVRDVREQLDATGENLVVYGTLINEADIPASGIEVRVLIISPLDGGTLDTARAIVNATELSPRTATRFTASFDRFTPGRGVVQVEVQVAEEDSGLYRIGEDIGS